MLKKLRIKLIAINMIIVTIILCAIFSLLYYSTKSSLERESVQRMNEILHMLNIMDKPEGADVKDKAGADVKDKAGAIAKDDADAGAKDNPGAAGNPETAQPLDAIESRYKRTPYLVINVDRDGAISSVNDEGYQLEDESDAKALLKEAKASGGESGVIEDNTTRFLHMITMEGESYIFTDISNEIAVLNNLRKNFAMVGGAAFLIFLLISFLLARWAVKPVEKAWAQQKQFVADASHELKTPLTVIMTDAELLKAEGCTQEEQSRLVDAIYTMSRQMRGLVESLLELARVERGGGEIEKVRFGLSETVTNSAMIFEPLFFEKEKSFSYDIEDKLSMKGDAGKLKQLVEILLDNALKYASEDGDIRLKLKSLGSHCVLTVSNKSEPISEKDIKEIFERFYRGDKSRAMNQSYGLGLSIAKTIVEDHRGKLWAKYEAGYFTISAEFSI